MPKVCQKRVVQKFKDETKPFRISNDSYLRGLKSTLDQTGIPSVYYSLEGYAEDAICIENNCGNWFVYSGERGNKYNLKKYKNIEDACYNLILRLSESEDEYRQIRNAFERELEKIAIINMYRRTPGEIGSFAVGAEVIVSRLHETTEHLKANPNDYYSRRRLPKKAGRIRGLLNYFKNIVTKGYYYLVNKIIRLKR